MRSLTLLFCLAAAPIFAQKQMGYLRGIYLFPKERYIRLHLEASAAVGLALPLQNTAKIGRDVAQNGYAQLGPAVELRLQHRFRRNALWSACISVGQSRNPFHADTAQLQNPQLADRYAVSGQAWRHTYFAPGIAYRVGKKFRAEAALSLCGSVIQGGPDSRQSWQADDQNPTYLVETWSARPQVALGLRLAASLGFAPSRRTFIALDASFYRLKGQRLRQLRETQYQWNEALQQPQRLLSDAQFSVQQPFQWQALHLAVAFRYQLYRSLYPHTRTTYSILYH